MARYQKVPVLPALLLLLSLQPAFAAITDADRKLVDEVYQRLIGVADPPLRSDWPPPFEIIDNDDIQAQAYNQNDDPKGDIQPKVEVFTGLLHQVIQGDPDRLAFILGHELTHALRRHIVHPENDPQHKTPFLHITFTRDQELEADQGGVAMALAAGYSFRGCKSAMTTFIDKGLEYSSFRGVGLDHPSWKERLAAIDKSQAKLWNSMAAFHSGTDLLMFEQFGPAAKAFEQVTREFPDCPEAWANLGYARLMQYCDGLETGDLRNFGVTQMVVGGFYERPQSLVQQVRGIDRKTWEQAVDALNHAIKLDSGLALPKANLGIAYLVSPDGKNAADAAKWLRQARDTPNWEQTAGPSLQAAVLVNNGVAELAAGNRDNAPAMFDRAAAIQEKMAAEKIPAVAGLAAALLYNRGVMLADSTVAANRQKAIQMFHGYFRAATPGSAWWPIAYERYAKLCQDLGEKPDTEPSLRQAASSGKRPITGVTIGKDQQITLGDNLADLEAKLGRPTIVPVVAGTKLMRYCYPKLGVEFIGNDRVVAIVLRGRGAPDLFVRGPELGSKAQALRLGMAWPEFRKLMGSQDIGTEPFLDPRIPYSVYRDLQLAVRVEDGKVVEMVVAFIPESRKEE